MSSPEADPRLDSPGDIDLHGLDGPAAGGSRPELEALPPAVRRAALGILRHVFDHRSAKDSLEGIHRFWLPDDGRAFESRDVEQGLDFLLDAGLFDQSSPGGHRVFSLRPEGTRSARLVLEQLQQLEQD